MAETTRDTQVFYFVADVMKILGYSRSKSYKIIAQMNGELENMGYMTFDGRVPRSYFHKRTGITPEELVEAKRPAKKHKATKLRTAV